MVSIMLSEAKKNLDSPPDTISGATEQLNSLSCSPLLFGCTHCLPPSLLLSDEPEMNRRDTGLKPRHLFKLKASPKTSPQAACFQNSRRASFRSRTAPPPACLLVRFNPPLNANTTQMTLAWIQFKAPVRLQESIKMFSSSFCCGNLPKNNIMFTNLHICNQILTCAM